MVLHFSTVFLLILIFFQFRKEKIERIKVCGKDEGMRDGGRGKRGEGVEEEGWRMRVGSAGCKFTTFLRDGQANSVGL